MCRVWQYCSECGCEMYADEWNELGDIKGMCDECIYQQMLEEEEECEIDEYYG